MQSAWRTGASKAVPGRLLTAAGLATAVLVAACGAPPNLGRVGVLNESRAEASLHWQSPGLLGTPLFGGSGTDPIPPCLLRIRGFAAGNHEIRVSTEFDEVDSILHAPDRGSTSLWYVIRADGRIEETTEAEANATPSCQP